MQLRQQKRRTLLQCPPRSSKDAVPSPVEKQFLMVLLGGLISVQVIILGLAGGVALWQQTRLDPQDVGTAFSVPNPSGGSLSVPVPPTPVPGPTATVTATATTTAASLVEGAPPPEAPPQNVAVHLRGLEITQGIQVLNEPENPRCNPDPAHADHIFCNNSLPLVADRHTMVRAYLACHDNCPGADTVVTLRVLKNGQPIDSRSQTLPAAEMQRLNSLPLFDQRGSLDNSLNFAFIPPPSWLADDVTFELNAVIPAEPQRPPAALTVTRNFARRDPLRIAYLPISVGGAQPGDASAAAYWLLRMFPVPAVEYSPLPTPDLTWGGDLSKSELLRQLLINYWFYAQSQPSEQRPDQLFGWLPQEIYNGGASDPFWCPNCAGPHSSRVAFGGLRPEQDIGAPRILAHEIAHNLGAQHAWSPTYQQDNACFRAEGVDIRVDPTWPYADTAHTQEFGIDLYSAPPVIYPPTRYDMMAYCAQPWISPHTYRKLFDSPFLQPDAVTAAEPLLANYQPQLELSDNGTLLVSGLIYPNGDVARPEIIKLADDALGSGAAFAAPVELNTPPGDDYCMQVFAADNSLLAEQCFEAGFEDVETGQPTDPAPYFFSLPDVDLSAVARVAITRQQAEQASATASQHAPQVSFSQPAPGQTLSGEQTIRWEANDPDGDPLQFDLLYSLDAGTSWLPLALGLHQTETTLVASQLWPTGEVWLRVIASDGFNTTTTDLPAPVRVEPAAGSRINLD